MTFSFISEITSSTSKILTEKTQIDILLFKLVQVSLSKVADDQTNQQ